MCRALEAYDTPITGAFLLALTPKQLEATLAKLKLRPDETAWASRVVLRLQQRRVIVGRSRREAPLPPGWTVVASRSRPGELSYKCTATGVRCAERPTAEAATAHMERGQAPLPQGWLPLPSQRWPGEVVYMHVKHKNLHLGWRPQVKSQKRPSVILIEFLSGYNFLLSSLILNLPPPTSPSPSRPYPWKTFNPLVTITGRCLSTPGLRQLTPSVATTAVVLVLLVLLQPQLLLRGLRTPPLLAPP